MSRLVDLTCKRCGIDFSITFEGKLKRESRGVPLDKCPDCETLDKPIKGYYNACRAWMGDVDELDRPIRNGKLWKPGVRTCGRADCVRIAHIIPSEIPQKRAERRSKPVKVVEPVIVPQAVIKPPKVAKPAKLPKALLEALEAERYDQTYRGEPKRTLKQLKKAVEVERYRQTPR